MALKDVIKTEVRYVIAAKVPEWDSKAGKNVYYTRFAQKDDYDTRWTWRKWDRATVFGSEKKARARWRYLAKSGTNATNVRVVKVTLHPQIEQVYPVPNIVDAVAALAVQGVQT